MSCQWCLLDLVSCLGSVIFSGGRSEESSPDPSAYWEVLQFASDHIMKLWGFINTKAFKSWHLSNSEWRLTCEWVTGILRFTLSHPSPFSQGAEVEQSPSWICVQKASQLQMADALLSIVTPWAGGVTISAPLILPGSFAGTHLRVIQFPDVCIFL